MIQLQQVILVFLIITLFLPLSFLTKSLSYFRFSSFIKFFVFAVILFLLNNNIDIYINFFWWLIIVLLTTNTSSMVNNWEWLFLISFIFLSLYIFLNGFLTNYLGLFILLEAQVIVFLILTQLENNSLVNIEAIARWCLLNVVSSMFLIISIGILYQSYGTINLVDLMLLNVSVDSYAKLGFILFYSAFLFKIGIPPFHFWLPDIYETNNIQIVAILVGPMKLFYIIVLQYFVILQGDFSVIFIFLGILSIVSGLFIALNQFNVKKFLAWTGIFYFGIFLLLLSNLTIENMLYLKVYMNFYLFSSLSFIILLQINITKLSDFMILFGDNFLIGIYFLSVLIVIIGLPIMSGFYSKLTFLYSLIATNISYLTTLILLMITSFAGFYYLNTFIYSLSFKYLLQNTVIIETLNMKLSMANYFVVLLIFLVIFFPYQLSILIFYLI